jgi:NAD(P)-dependent dehydrogenase (short-subunit alcohol dehydrogenase family)
MQAIKAITSATPPPKNPGTLKFLHLDLNDLNSVKAATSTFASRETKLHVLWNNAGTGAYRVSQGARTAQGLEAMVGMHCVATLLFTTLLIPQLRIAAAEEPSSSNNSARVVWTSSIVTDQGSPTYGINLETLDTGSPDRVLNYAVSKAGSWMLSREMARRYGNEGIVSVAQNPGNVKGGSYEGTPAATMWFLNRFVLHAPACGAYTELYAGLSPDIDNGTYIIPWGRMRPDDECPRKDIVHAMLPEKDGGLDYGKKLWDWCEKQWASVV